MAPRKEATHAPGDALRYRLPNPPPVFVGREDEARRLRTAVARGPVAVVCGLGGLGKTSLVLHVLREEPDQLVKTVFVSLRPGDPPEQLLVEVLRALLSFEGSDAPPWRRLLANSEMMLVTALDLAESREARVVL